MKLPTFLKKETIPFLVLGVAPIPLLFLLGLFFFQMQSVSEKSLQVASLQQRCLQLTEQKQKEQEFLAKIKKSGDNFLETNLESLSFASPYPARGGGENRLQFLEENPKTFEQLEEVEVKLKQAVMLNEEELKKILSLIEGVQIGSFLPEEFAPQLTIKNFVLAKQLNQGDEEMFEVALQIIKREPVKNR